jgi:hypothetical protein
LRNSWISNESRPNSLEANRSSTLSSTSTQSSTFTQSSTLTAQSSTFIQAPSPTVRFSGSRYGPRPSALEPQFELYTKRYTGKPGGIHSPEIFMRTNSPAYTSVHAAINPPPPRKRIVNGIGFDGGGHRTRSQLYMLKHIIDRLNAEGKCMSRRPIEMFDFMSATCFAA